MPRMYTGHGFSEWGIGDVDVVKVDGTYHLFHLMLPNHAYIAHAISRDGLTWERVPNALFVGDPGAWDDDMLWTMHVTRDPASPATWRMFYTGLSRKEGGRVQRVGLAVSEDLYNWRKVDAGFPLSVPGPHYESSIDEGRHWVSFRDPFYTRVNGEGWLLVAGRASTGPIVRRGCVVLARETAPNEFEFQPPLHFPRLYDDVEVPSLVQIDGHWYLIGSIREDVKVHYWYAEQPEGPYRNYFDNVLMPQGNYAARVCDEGDRCTLWNFYYLASKIKGTGNMLPPPKELFRADDGQLKLRSFSGFDDKVVETLQGREFTTLAASQHNPAAAHVEKGVSYWLSSESALELFLLPRPLGDFRLRATFELTEPGKCGLVLRMSEDTDGYFISLDLIKGVVQARASGANPEGGIEEAFIYQPLQANYFRPKQEAIRYEMELVAFGQYMELSLDGRILLTFADDRYDFGYLGYYTEGAQLRVDDVVLQRLEAPKGELHTPAPIDVGPIQSPTESHHG
jgi:beta-fructofuranosidase